ncbi:MAG: winged helix-turn-helix transcriptional regulator [Thermosipho sp. (in: Bacteria)]|nr:winged helix-turn-helix transcriptional regulator [Thermosipho sp. (in: thermotogales)]
MIKLIEIVKLFSDETRARILFLLWHRKLCNCDLESVLNITQSNISKHMKKAELLNVVKKTKDSYWTYYCINKRFVKKYRFIEEIIEEFSNIEPFKSDLLKLKEYLKKPGRCSSGG